MQPHSQPPQTTLVVDEQAPEGHHLGALHMVGVRRWRLVRPPHGHGVGLEGDEAARRQLVELIAEVRGQSVDVVVCGLVVAQRFEPVFERFEALAVLVARAAGCSPRLEIDEDERLVGRLELADRSLELLCRIAADLGPEQQHEEVAVADLAVVFILQPCLRHDVQKVLPDDKLDEDALADPRLVLAVDEDLERLPVRDQLRRRGEEDSDAFNHSALRALRRCQRIVSGCLLGRHPKFGERQSGGGASRQRVLEVPQHVRPKHASHRRDIISVMPHFSPHGEPRPCWYCRSFAGLANAGTTSVCDNSPSCRI